MANAASLNLNTLCRPWKEKGWPILFGNEVSFAQWVSFSYTWSPKSQQPQVKTSRVRKGCKVFSTIEFFSGKLFYEGIEERFNSDSYQTLLQYLLLQLPGSILDQDDGAGYHTSKATCNFITQHQDRLIVYQLPSYSPDYNPIEYLWKKVKTKATQNRYFVQFAKLLQSVEESLVILASQPNEIMRLMGVYTKYMTDPLAA